MTDTRASLTDKTNTDASSSRNKGLEEMRTSISLPGTTLGAVYSSTLP